MEAKFQEQLAAAAAAQQQAAESVKELEANTVRCLGHTRQFQPCMNEIDCLF